jgi:branched-chain amino acid transport system ATP-binding protein
MLKLSNLSAGYGRINVLHTISLEVQRNTICGLLGPNGAGKTTLVKAVSGLVPRRSGSIVFDGNSIDRVKAEKIVSLGLIQVAQGRLLFPELTVEENLQMGAYLKRSREKYSVNLKRVEELFPRLAERRHQLAGTLSGGEQQMLAVGRALMSCPRFLILDEPSLGLGPRIVDEIFSVIKRINEESTTILLAEQNARKVLTIAQECYVIESGRIAIQGVAAHLLEDEQVRRSYLGIH